MNNIKIKNLSKIFNHNIIAVDDISLEIDDKDFFVLLGPSGCGKSTTLRLIGGLENVTHGKIFLGENDITNVDPKDRDLAFVFQNYALYPHMNVKKNLSFPAFLCNEINWLQSTYLILSPYYGNNFSWR